MQVRRSVSNTVKRLQKEIPGIRIAVIAHGDYWDSHTYVTKIMDFSTDGNKLCDFVENVQRTGVCVCVYIRVWVMYLCGVMMWQWVCGGIKTGVFLLYSYWLCKSWTPIDTVHLHSYAE